MTKRVYALALILLVSLGGLYLGLRHMKGAMIGNMAYGPDVRNRLDVYKGRGCPAEGCPVLVAVHGGGWSGGDKSDFYHSGVAVALVRQGFTVIAPNYRLSPQHKHPAHVEDVAMAIAWAHQNISSYSGSPQRIYLLGHSAGAHLVSLVATSPFYLARYGYRPEQLAGVVSLDTASLDLDRRIRVWGEDDKMRTNTFTPGTEHAASPFWHVEPGRGYPPFLLVAASDSSESIRQAGAMAAKLVGAGSNAQVAVIPYEGIKNSHMQIFLDLARPDTVVSQRLAAFLTGAASY